MIARDIKNIICIATVEKQNSELTIEESVIEDGDGGGIILDEIILSILGFKTNVLMNAHLGKSLELKIRFWIQNSKY